MSPLHRSTASANVNDMAHLFCYGSLMFIPVWSRVVQGAYERLEGQLRGFQRRGVKGASYPCLISGTHDDVVDGVIYLHVTADDLARLDAFEGELYDRQSAVCLGTDQRSYDVEVYVLKARHRSVATDTGWNVAWFATEGLSQFLGDYQGFEA